MSPWSSCFEIMVLLPHCIISIRKRASCVISGADLGFSSRTVYVLLISLRHDGRHFLFRHWSGKEEKPFGQSINRNVTELSDTWSKGLGVGDTVTEGPIFWNRDKYNVRGPRRAAGQLWVRYQHCQGRWRWRSKSSWKSLAWGELKGTAFARSRGRKQYAAFTQGHDIWDDHKGRE